MRGAISNGSLSVRDAIPEDFSANAARGNANGKAGLNRQATDSRNGTSASYSQSVNNYQTIPSVSLNDSRDMVAYSNSNWRCDTASNSNRASFSSTFNSFIGFCTLTRGRYQKSPSKCTGIGTGISATIDYTDSPIGALGAGQHGKPQHYQSMDMLNKVRTTDMSKQKQKRVENDGGFAKPQLTDIMMPKLWAQPQDDPKSLKGAATMSCAVLLKDNKTQQEADHKATAKSAADYQQAKKPPRQEFYGAMPSCYVIAKDKDSVYKRLCPGNQNTFSIMLSSNKSGTVKQVRAIRPEANDAAAADMHNGTSPNGHTQDYQAGSAAKQGSKGALITSKLFQFMKNKGDSGDVVLSNASTVTIVNKGNANIMILKFQSFCKNYIDVNPDFGWRRLVEEYSPLDAGGSEESAKTPPSQDETHAQRSYMYYRETKKMTHAIGLAELAINIACRALMLGVAHGIIDGAELPQFMREMLNHQYAGVGIPDYKEKALIQSDNPQGNPRKRAMYLKSSFLGLFVTSSIRSILGSNAYKDRITLSKRSFIWNMRFMSKKRQGKAKNASESDGSPNVYDYIPIPDYGWRLAQRSHFDRRITDADSCDRGNTSILGKISKVLRRKSANGLTTTSIYSNAVLCKIRPPHVDDPRAFIHADVGSIAMNIAEQLYRLEVRQMSREKLPKKTFGFKVHAQNTVMPPCGKEFRIVPEELILNTATLVHEMYITQTCLIL